MLFRVFSSLGYSCRRQFSSKPPSNADSVLKRIKDFVFSTEKENFHSDFVQRAHKWDKLSRDEWKLIYKDIGASRSFLLVSTALPLSLVGSIALGCDWYFNEPSNRSALLKRLQKDIHELGLLTVFPLAAVVCVIAVLWRVHSCRVLRIYQNKLRVDDFMVVRSRFVVSQHKMPFERSSATAFYYDEDREVLKMMLNFLFGNIQIARRKFFVLDECFLGNNYRSYMLNETSVPPRLATTKK